MQYNDELARDLAEAVRRAFRAYKTTRWLLIIDDVWDADDMSSANGLGLLTLDASVCAGSIIVTSRRDLAYDWPGCTSIKLTEASNEPCAEKMLAGFARSKDGWPLPSELEVR